MRWWLNTDDPKIFSVDNAATTGMDFSLLDPSIWMVQWIDGKGEVEHQTSDGKNENGLRESFYDIIPYCSLFQNFLEKLPRLTLPQAQKVQVELIIEVYNAKRQAPYHYPVAAGDYWWDASDAAVAVNPSAAIQSIIVTLNSLIGKVNTLAHEINSIVVTQVNAIVVGQVNSIVVGGVNNTVVAGVNASVVGGVNAAIVAPGNALVTHINSQIIDVSNALRGYIDNTFRDTVNTHCMRTDIGGGSYAAAPGIDQAGIPASGVAFSALGDGLGQISGIGGIGGIAGIAGVNWSDQSPVPGQAGSSFVPIGGTVPVPVTAAEIAAIQSGIAARAQDLNVKKNKKISEVNALTKIPDVIAYDVTTGW